LQDDAADLKHAVAEPLHFASRTGFPLGPITSSLFDVAHPVSAIPTQNKAILFI